MGSFQGISNQKCGEKKNSKKLICFLFFLPKCWYKDDDECALGRHNCIKPFECRNTKGSFRCEKPRYTTTSTTTTTTTSTTTTKRPYVHTQYYPTHTQSYSSRLNVWPHTTTPVPRQIDYDQRYGQCNEGFQRSNQGACIGNQFLLRFSIKWFTTFPKKFHVQKQQTSMNVLNLILVDATKDASTQMDRTSVKVCFSAPADTHPMMKELSALVHTLI